MATIAMSRDSAEERDAARAQVKQEYSLPAYYYTSPECFREDVRQIRNKMWLIAGHSSQIPNVGDYKLYQLAHEKVILVRDQTGKINGFYNVCRHRGAHICTESQGNVKAFVCPYHAWTYKLDGGLMRPRSMPKDFDPKEWGLVPCAVETLEGIIFVNLSEGTPPDFEEFAGGVRPYVAQYGLGGLKVVAEKEWISESNWKMSCENFRENYHVPSVHDDLGRVLVTSHSEVEPVDANGETYSDRMKRLGRSLPMIFETEDSRYLQTAAQMEIGHGHMSVTMDGKPKSSLLDGFTEFTGGWTIVNFNPFAHALLYDDYVIFVMYTPREVTKTAGTMIVLVGNDAVEGVDYQLADLMALMDTTMNEDTAILDLNQKGLNSFAYSPAPLSKEEDLVAIFHRWYFNQLVK